MKIYKYKRELNRVTLPLQDFAKLCYDDILNYQNERMVKEVMLPDNAKIEEVVLYSGPVTHVRFVAFRVIGERVNYFALAPFTGVVSNHL